MPIKAEDLIGGWHLEAWEIRYGDGRDKSFPFGEDAVGLLIYTADGFMSAAISRPGRVALSTANLRAAPPAEKAAAFDSYFHYSGTWRIEGDSVIHAVSLALNPAFVGTDQIRLMELQSDRLTLSARDVLPGGGSRQHCLIWRKA